MQGVKARWIRVVFWIAAVAYFLVCLLFPYYMRKAIRKDRTETIPQEGTATVAILVPPSQDANGTPSPAQASVRFQGQVLGAKEVFGVPELAIGKEARIIYRIGKSGHIYVDRVTPLRPTP